MSGRWEEQVANMDEASKRLFAVFEMLTEQRRYPTLIDTGGHAGELWGAVSVLWRCVSSSAACQAGAAVPFELEHEIARLLITPAS